MIMHVSGDFLYVSAVFFRLQPSVSWSRGKDFRPLSNASLLRQDVQYCYVCVVR